MKKILLTILGALTFSACAQTPISQLPTTTGFGPNDAIVNYVESDAVGNRKAYAESISNLFGITLDESKIIVSGSDTNDVNGVYSLKQGFLPVVDAPLNWAWTNSAGYRIFLVGTGDGMSWSLFTPDSSQIAYKVSSSVGISPNVTWETNDYTGTPPTVRFAQISDFGAGGNAENWTLKNVPSSAISPVLIPAFGGFIRNGQVDPLTLVGGVIANNCYSCVGETSIGSWPSDYAISLPDGIYTNFQSAFSSRRSPGIAPTTNIFVTVAINGNPVITNILNTTVTNVVSTNYFKLTGGTNEANMDIWSDHDGNITGLYLHWSCDKIWNNPN